MCILPTLHACRGVTTGPLGNPAPPLMERSQPEPHLRLGAAGPFMAASAKSRACHSLDWRCAV